MSARLIVDKLHEMGLIPHNKAFEKEDRSEFGKGKETSGSTGARSLWSFWRKS